MSEELKQAAQELGGVPTEKHLTQKQGVDAILNLHKANSDVFWIIAYLNSPLDPRD
jgi:hypothetical protein